MSDAPLFFSNKKKSSRESKNDPRFTEKPNTSTHIKNYSFLYPKEMIRTLRKREERARLENELVKSGKKKFYMSKKLLKKLEEDEE